MKWIPAKLDVNGRLWGTGLLEQKNTVGNPLKDGGDVSHALGVMVWHVYMYSMRFQVGKTRSPFLLLVLGTGTHGPYSGRGVWAWPTWLCYLH